MKEFVFIIVDLRYPPFALPSVRGLAYSSFFFSPPLKPRCQGRVIGFVGGGGNIAIATALPPSFRVYCVVNI